MDDKVKSKVADGRWVTSNCARCGAQFTAMTRSAPIKFCDKCRDEIRIERRREMDKRRGPRKYVVRKKNALIRYAGWEGSR